MKLLDYIQGNRKGKAANRLEREAMEDPFLHDALEGFDAVEGDHDEALQRLQARVAQRSAVLPRRRRQRVWAAVAAVLLVGSVGSLFLLLQRDPVLPPVATLTPEQRQDTVKPLAVVTPSAEAEEQKARAEETTQEPPAVSVTADAINIVENDARITSDLNFEVHEEVAVEVPILSPAPVVEESPAEEAPFIIIEQRESKPAAATGDFSAMQDASKDKRAKIAKSRVVSGQVLAADDGQPIIGATVQVVGTTQGAVTNLEGEYQLEAKEGDKIRLSYLGYEPKEYKVDRPVIDAVLDPDEQVLSEVVVVAYGTARKREQASASLGSGTVASREEALCQQLKEALTPLLDASELDAGAGIVIEFDLSERGYPVNIRIVEGLNQKADKEAKRQVRREDAWPVADTTIRLEVQF